MKAIVLILSVAPTLALACTPPPTNFTTFQPTYNSVRVDDKFPQVPAVQIESIDIRRASLKKANECGYMSTLTIRIHWPESRTFPIESMGFYIRAVSGNLPTSLFPREPISILHADNGRAEISISWQDDPSEKQKTLGFVLEVLPIDRWLHLGPSTVKKVP